MKLRIKANTLRLRLSQTEVAMLAEGKAVEENTSFTLLHKLVVRVEPWLLNTIEAKLEGSTITLFCSQEQLNQWANSDQVGIETTQENNTESLLQILIEKDFACLSPRTDEHDNFPNLQAGTAKC
jgi:hypothetical protein